LTIEQAAEKLDPEGGGGFDSRIMPTEASRALAPERHFPTFSPKVPGFSAASEAAHEPCAGQSEIEVHCYLLFNQAGGRSPLYLLPGLHVEISASEIREQIRAALGDPADGRELLPRAVLEAIRERGLYR
jgi:hypothetical protein